MGESLKSQDFLLDFYKENPDAIYQIGEWQTELQCIQCSGPIDKEAHCLYNQQFPTTNHISGHIRPNGKSYFEKSKIPKLAKKLILAKNSNFDRVADIGRNDDIWPEMGP